MKKNKNIERRIRLNAILIYIIVVLLCGGIFVYFYNQKEIIRFQKQKIEKNRKTLMLTNNLISFVNQAQSNANLYIALKRQEHILQFMENVKEVHCSVDSLKTRDLQFSQKTILVDIESLFGKKAKTISDLNVQFDSYNLVDSISRKLWMYEMSAVLVSQKSQVTTTVTSNEDILRKGFFKRLADVFASDKKSKKKSQEVTTVTETVDTLNVNPPYKVDTGSLFSELLNIAHNASKRYVSQIKAIEKQVAELMTFDHEISIQLSNLLIDLHQQTIDTTMMEIQKSEQLIRHNYIKSIVGSLISLLLILVLTIFIIKNADKERKMCVAVEQANVRIKKAFENKHKLLLSISHDIKTPINSMLGCLELWKHGHVISTREIVAMQHSAQHILDLMENLLEFSRLDQGLLKVTMANFRLHDFCTEIIELFSPLTLQKKLSFEVSLDFDSTLQINSDVFRIKRIVINILSNAVKYTVKGSVQFKVSYNNGYVYFDINDTGKGIPSEKIDAVFEAFTRIEENNSLAAGSGLGLFVVKGITNLLKGTITVHSVVGKGTQIKIAIPAQKIPDQDIKPVSKRILVIDDDLVLLPVLEKMLSELGHKVNTCHTMEICEKQIEQIADYDVILTDADMITFSGRDILQKIKDKGIKLPVVLMSGRSDLSNAEAIQLGFSGFLQKPVTINSLGQTFGGNENVPKNLSPSLEELFGGDKDVIRKVLKAFVEDTIKHIALLEQAVMENDFAKARRICHKMLPMFMQLGASNGVVILTKMGELQGNKENEHLPWKEDILNLINISKNLIKEIEKKF